jgi:hypothetical protein
MLAEVSDLCFNTRDSALDTNKNYKGRQRVEEEQRITRNSSR